MAVAGAALGLALLVPARGAVAQGTHYRFGVPGAGLPEKGAYGPGVLTPQQVEACLQRWQALSAVREKLQQDERQLDQLEAELQTPRRGAAAQRGAGQRRGGAQAPAVPPAQAEAEHQAKLETAYSLRRSYMEAVAQYGVQVQGFNAECATRRYYEEDMRAARTRLGIAD